MNIPTNLKYTVTDEWVNVEGNIATIGVTDFAQDQLSDVVFVEILVTPSKMITKGSTLATIESVKAAADVTLPVSGKVIQINETLAQTPEIINTDPFGAAWMVKIELSDLTEISSLLDSAGYQKSIDSRSH